MSFNRFLSYSSTTQRVAVGSFFGLLLLAGLLLHRDYGVSTDEPNNHLNGLVSAKYLAQLVAPELVARQPSSHLIPDLRDFRDADHGVAFELPVTILSYLFTPRNPQAYYWLRHLCIFLVFVVGVWALYRIGTIQFGDWRWGLLGAAMLMLSPRFFAEAFYNGKDIVYMALFTLAIYTLIRFLQQPTPGRAVLHGLATAVAIDVRVQGLLLLVVTLAMLVLDAATRPAAERPRWRMAGLGALYAVAALLFTFLGWPYLWATPISELLNVSQRISQYSLWPGRVIYFGQYLAGHQIPWHYIPVWIIITTPLPYLLAAGLGLLLQVRAGLRGGFSTSAPSRRAWACSSSGGCWGPFSSLWRCTRWSTTAGATSTLSTRPCCCWPCRAGGRSGAMSSSNRRAWGGGWPTGCCWPVGWRWAAPWYAWCACTPTSRCTSAFYRPAR